MKIKRGFIINLFFTILIGLFGFVINVFFADYLGANELGLLRLFIQMVAFLNLAELGLSAAAAFALYKPLSDGDFHDISIIFSTLNDFYNKISFIVIVFGVIISLFLRDIAGKNNVDDIYIIWSIFVMATAVSYSFSKYSVVFLANQEYSFVRTIQGSIKTVTIIIQLSLLYFFHSFLLYAILLLIEGVINFLVFRFYFNKKFTDVKIVKDRKISIAKDMKNLFFHSISGVVVFNTDYIILAKYETLEVIAIYASYLMISQMIVMLVNVIIPVLTPHIGNYVVNNEKKAIYEYWDILNSIFLIKATAVCVVCYFTMSPFVRLWMGSDFILSQSVVALLIVNLFFQISRSVTEVFKNSSGYFSDTFNPILEAVINIVASVYLVREHGLAGVIIGTIFSNVIVVYILKPMLVFKNCFDKKIIDYIKNYGLNLLLVAISGFVSISAISVSGFDADVVATWLDWIIESAIITVLTLLVTVFVFSVKSNVRKKIGILTTLSWIK